MDFKRFPDLKIWTYIRLNVAWNATQIAFQNHQFYWFQWMLVSFGMFVSYCFQNEHTEIRYVIVLSDNRLRWVILGMLHPKMYFIEQVMSGRKRIQKQKQYPAQAEWHIESHCLVILFRNIQLIEMFMSFWVMIKTTQTVSMPNISMHVQVCIWWRKSRFILLCSFMCSTCIKMFLFYVSLVVPSGYKTIEKKKHDVHKMPFNIQYCTAKLVSHWKSHEKFNRKVKTIQMGNKTIFDLNVWIDNNKHYVLGIEENIIWFNKHRVLRTVNQITIEIARQTKPNGF